MIYSYLQLSKQTVNKFSCNCIARYFAAHAVNTHRDTTKADDGHFAATWNQGCCERARRMEFNCRWHHRPWCEQRCTAFSGFKQPQDLSFKLPPSSPSVFTRRCAEAAVYPARRTCASLISCLRAFSHARAAWGMRHFQNAEFYKKRSVWS